MLSWASSEFVAAISFLLPGFLAAWVFYGLTAHPRREPFERLVQAVIFTGVVHALNYGVEWSLGKATAYVTLGTWTKEVAACWSFADAVFIGVLFSVLANYGWLHWVLRKIGITKRTSFPSEWFSAFNRDKRYVVLHLEGDRRLHGWPEEWPDSADCGHFVMCDASWMLDTNELVPIHAVEQLVIPVTSVKMVERLKTPKEITASPEMIANAERKLIALYDKDSDNGEQSTRSVPAENRTAGANGQAAHGTNPAAPPANSPAPAAPQGIGKRKGKRGRR